MAPQSVRGIDVASRRSSVEEERLKSVRGQRADAECERSEANRATLVTFIGVLIEATRIIYNQTDNALVIEVMMELGQTDREHAARAIAEMREGEAFARDLEIPRSALPNR